MADEQRINLLDAIAQPQDIYAAIFFTYGADFVFFEEAILHRLWQTNCNNVLVFMDSTQYANTIRDFANSIAWAGVRYLPIPVDLASGSIFHPKMVLLLGENSGRLLIGSGNVGFTGYGQNLEIYSCFDWNRSESSRKSLLHAAWDLCLNVAGRWCNTDSTQQVLQRIAQAIPWLQEETAPDPEVMLLHTLEHPLLPQVRSLLADEPIERITIITPFLDQRAEAVQAILDTFKPAALRLILQNGRAVGELDALRRLQGSGYPLSIWTLEDVSRYLHAKLYLFESTTQTHVLSGSANCTWACIVGHAATRQCRNQPASSWRAAWCRRRSSVRVGSAGTCRWTRKRLDSCNP